MIRMRHVPLVAGALARWAYRSRAGRKTVAVLGAAAALVVGLASLGTHEEPELSQKERKGSWSGLRQMIAPTSGAISIDGAPGADASCTVRGLTHSAGAGEQWAFRGDAWVRESTCKGRMGKDGKVSLRLELVNEYHGKIKAIGSDWDEVHGRVTCEGDLEGDVADGGRWNATCRQERSTWKTSFEWKLEPSGQPASE